MESPPPSYEQAVGAPGVHNQTNDFYIYCETPPQDEPTRVQDTSPILPKRHSTRMTPLIFCFIITVTIVLIGAALIFILHGHNTKYKYGFRAYNDYKNNREINHIAKASLDKVLKDNEHNIDVMYHNMGEALNVENRYDAKDEMENYLYEKMEYYKKLMEQWSSTTEHTA